MSAHPAREKTRFCDWKERNVTVCYDTSWEHQASGRLPLTSDGMHRACGGSYGVASPYESHHPHVMSVSVCVWVCVRCSPLAAVKRFYKPLTFVPVVARHVHVVCLLADCYFRRWRRAVVSLIRANMADYTAGYVKRHLRTFQLVVWCETECLETFPDVGFTVEP